MPMPIASATKVSTATASVSAASVQVGSSPRSVLRQIENAVAHHPAEQAGDEGRQPDVRLGLLEEMDQRQQADAIDDLVQPLPALAAEAAHHAVGRGHRQRRKAQQRDEADGEIEPQHDLACDLPEIEHLVGDVEQRYARRHRQKAPTPIMRRTSSRRPKRPIRRSGVTASDIIRNSSAQ